MGPSESFCSSTASGEAQGVCVVRANAQPDKGCRETFYSKASEFHADVWACVHADSSALREQLQKGIQAKDIGQYIVPLVRWGSAVLDKVCKILDMYCNKDRQFNSQRGDRLLRDTWIDFHTEVRS